MSDRYPKLSEKIHSERNWLRCKADWVAHAVELEQENERLKSFIADTLHRDALSVLSEDAQAGAGETLPSDDEIELTYGQDPATGEFRYAVTDAQAGAGGKEQGDVAPAVGEGHCGNSWKGCGRTRSSANACACPCVRCGGAGGKDPK